MLNADQLPFYIARILILLLGTLGMMSTTLEFQCSLKKLLLITALFVVYVTLSTYALLRLFSYLFFARIFLLSISVPALIITHKLSKGPLTKTLFVHATQILASLYLLFTLTLLWPLLSLSTMEYLVLNVLCYALVILLECRFIRQRFLTFSHTITKGWGILSLVPCALIILSVTLSLYPQHYTSSPSTVVLVYMLGAVIIIFYFSIFQYLRLQYSFNVQTHNQEILALQVQQLKENITQHQLSAQQLRIEKHDLRHMLSTISLLVEKGDRSAVLDYLHSQMPPAQPQPFQRYCNDSILDATLSLHFHQAEAAHIRLERHFSIPDTLPVDSAELSIVFANAIENAINACRKLPEKQRYISVKCIHEPQLMLSISNPYAGNIAFSRDGLPQAEASGHGFGARSIQAFCKKNGASYRFEAQNGVFTLTIVL